MWVPNTRRALFTEMNVHVYSLSSSASFIPIGYGPLIKQRKLICFRAWWAGCLFHMVVWAMSPPCETVGGPYLSDMWPRPFVISNLLRDALCVGPSTVFFLKTCLWNFYFWPCVALGEWEWHCWSFSCHCGALSYTRYEWFPYTHESTHQTPYISTSKNVSY